MFIKPAIKILIIHSNCTCCNDDCNIPPISASIKNGCQNHNDDCDIEMWLYMQYFCNINC